MIALRPDLPNLCRVLTSAIKAIFIGLLSTSAQLRGPEM